ncbi:hypothetical protein GE061_004588 [Apolygus lucorum]|uniref:Uncharacterized protein n=1 Tax=Apolygus lucorum TaxID=248454 RepID=A0A8S9WZ50_APOLU|nr:hypothetical protein GE061_004588 [Apolygus lucorum]
MQSRSRSSSSVRCGCQYFQSTDPLPERLSLVGTPPVSRQSTMGALIAGVLLSRSWDIEMDFAPTANLIQVTLIK